MRIWPFSGGVHPRDWKGLAAGKAIEVLPAPPLLIVPLAQHIGAPSEAIVKPGDMVKAGQPLSAAKGFVSVPCHAPVSGKVKEIIPALHPLGSMVPAVIIENDGQNTLSEGMGIPGDPSGLTAKEIIELVQRSGMAGMGGATFPTHVKLSPPPEKKIDTLIINGVECEPYLTADYRLMLERGEDLLAGIGILKRVLAPGNIIIGIEANKPQAIQHLKQLAAKADGIRVATLKVKYPQGAEKQLVYALTKRQVPCGGLPMDVGCLVQNVGTVIAVHEAVTMRKPLFERVVTVTGPGVVEPKNLLVKIGTPYAELFKACGGLKETAAKIIMGGPMMGIAQFNDQVPVIKGTSGVLVLAEKDICRTAAQPCISCGRCVDACPMQLVPTTIVKLVEHKRFEDAKSCGLVDCIECGCCTYICPAKIDLVHHVKHGKAELARLARLKTAKG